MTQHACGRSATNFEGELCIDKILIEGNLELESFRADSPQGRLSTSSKRTLERSSVRISPPRKEDEENFYKRRKNNFMPNELTLG